MCDDFSQKSYELHKKHFKKFAEGGEQEKDANRWFDSTTVDAWRHTRMRRSIDPLLSDLDSSWLTIGDGRYGTDAHYILSKGIKNVVASDISEYLLKEAKERGFIPEFKQENAENLSFSEGKFDYVFCKESYHHFPRPIVALYEMLRVCKKGVVLIEPNDPNILNPNDQILFFGIKSVVLKILNKKLLLNGYEESGNFIYGISVREVEKVALGINSGSIIAYKGINDYYVEGVGYAKTNPESVLFKKVKTVISKHDRLSRIGLRNWDLLIIIIFKEKPIDSIMEKICIEGFNIIELSKNPYIQ